MVGVHVDRLDEVLDEDAPFLVGCFVPDGFDVDGGEQLGDVLELVGELAALSGLLGVLTVCPFQLLYLGGEASFFGCEGVGADLVGVVQVEEFGELASKPAEGWWVGCGFVRFGVAAELGSDGGLQFGVVGEQVEPEQGGSVEAGGGSAGNVAALSTVFAPVDGVGTVVVFDAENFRAESAAHPTGEEVGAASLAGGVGPLGGVELSFGDERFVDARVPLVVVADVAAVGAVEGDLADGGVFDPGAFLDGGVAEPVGS